jgi:hypothetical protein
MAPPKKTQKVIYKQSSSGHRLTADGSSVLYALHAGEEADKPMDEAIRLRDAGIVRFAENQ